jgi:hypothetical protein
LKSQSVLTPGPWESRSSMIFVREFVG